MHLQIDLSFKRLGRNFSSEIHKDRFIPHAIHYMAQTDQKSMVVILLDCEPTLVNRVEMQHQMTALMYTSLSNNPEMVLLLLSRGADMHLTNSTNYTALYFANSFGYEKIVFPLLQHAENHQKNNEQATEHESISAKATNYINSRKFFASRISSYLTNDSEIHKNSYIGKLN